MTIKTCIENGVKALDGISTTPRLDALVLLESVTGTDRAKLLADLNQIIGQSAHGSFKKLLQKRVQNVPVAYLTGRKEFYGLDLIVNQNVLIPRPESESLVEYAIAYTPKNGQLLDLGTGSGALAIACAVNRPDLFVIASDNSEVALEVARENARIFRVNVEFVNSDLFDRIKGRFDTIVANLPYLPEMAAISPEARLEPPQALFAGDDGLEIYREFFKKVKRYLTPIGHIILESDPRQHPDLKSLAQTKGFRLITSNDYSLVFGP